MNRQDGMKRRNFLKNSALGIVGAGVLGAGGPLLSQNSKTQAPMDAPKPQALKIKSFRTLGRTGFKVSDISTGGPGNEGVLNALLDAGINYIDTAESYGKGASETTTGNVIKTRDRKSLFITSKLVMKPDDTKETIITRFKACLARLQTDYLDCMMMHNAPKVETLKFEPFHEAMKQMKSEGKLKYVGMSNHGSQWGGDGETMEAVCLAAVADGRFDVMLLVYNFLQEEVGNKIIKACHEKNIGVTLMKTNPVGMYLDTQAMMEKMKSEGKEIPKRLLDRMEQFKIQYDQAQGFLKKYNLVNPVEIRDAAIKFTLSNPHVNTVCCSFESFEDIEGFVKLSGTTLTPIEQKKLSLYREGCGSLYCRHACGICESQCPSKVPVNTVMRYSHYFDAQGREKFAMQKYASLSTSKADNCMNCHGKCETACPHGLPVQALMAMAHSRLTLV